MFQRPLELFGGTPKGFVEPGRHMVDGHGRVADQPGFNQAALLVGTQAVAVLVAQMHLQRGDLVSKPAQSIGQLIARLCKTRTIRAGSIVGTGPLGTPGTEEKGLTEHLKFGDTIRVEMKGSDGQSLFGAIDQEVVPLVRT